MMVRVWAQGGGWLEIGHTKFSSKNWQPIGQSLVRPNYDHFTSCSVARVNAHVGNAGLDTMEGGATSRGWSSPSNDTGC